MQYNLISSFHCPTTIYMGVGASNKIIDILDSYKTNKVLIFLDAALENSAFYSNIKQILINKNTIFEVFTDIEPEPSVETVEKGYALCKKINADLLFAIGGGSTIDAAKAVGILMTNGGNIQNYEGIEKFKIPPLPLVAIPTTAGTGSEVSGSCVITDTKRQLKMSIRHATLNPAKIAILDPQAISTLPAHVAIHSGIDAFVHAFESYISKQSNIFTDAMNIEAIRLLSLNIRQFTANRDNLNAGLNMLAGSALAGMTFGQTGLGNVHCMARFIGAYYGLSHGFSNALCLPHVAAYNLNACPEKYVKIAIAMGEKVDGLETIEAAKKAVHAIRQLCIDLAIPTNLRSVGIDDKKFKEMAQLCYEANYNRWNPRYTTESDFLMLFQNAL